MIGAAAEAGGRGQFFQKNPTGISIHDPSRADSESPLSAAKRWTPHPDVAETIIHRQIAGSAIAPPYNRLI
jgi:hypothetical protein